MMLLLRFFGVSFESYYPLYSCELETALQKTSRLQWDKFTWQIHVFISIFCC